MKVSYTKALQAPSIILLLLWMIVPLSMTLYFSFMRYNLLYPERTGFTGSLNYDFFLTDPALFDAVLNTLTLVGSIITISVVLGMGIALLLQEAFRGRGIVRVMLISPFFIMPTVNALIWKNMFGKETVPCARRKNAGRTPMLRSNMYALTRSRERSDRGIQLSSLIIS